MAAAQGAGSSVAGPSGAPTSVPGHGSTPAVAVWEWQDEFGRWRPYRGNVCSYIEQVFQASQQKGRRSGSGLVSSIPLGHADAVLAPYVIDIPSLTQFRQDTGKGAPLPRRDFGRAARVLGERWGRRALRSSAAAAGGYLLAGTSAALPALPATQHVSESALGIRGAVLGRRR